jgi:protein-tyrosine kinase
MSKFFDRARSAQPSVASAAIATRTESDRWTEELRNVNVLSTQIADNRLARCRKTTVATPPNSPTLNDADVAAGNAVESYRMLRTRLMRAQAAQGLRSLIFSSAVSNEGKTLTTFNLGQAYASLKEQRVLLIDGDLREGGLSRYFSPVAGPGLANALSGEASFADVVLATDKPNLFFVPTGSQGAPPPELYASPRWKEFLAWCGECFKVVIVDAPPIFPCSDFDLMSAACDGIVLVVRAHRTQRELLQRAAAQVDSKKLLGIVYNGTQSEHRKSKYNHPYLSGESS